MPTPPTPNEIFIETQRVGTAMRVTAIDAATGIEVVFQAPAKTSKLAIHRLAMKKLEYVLKKPPE